MKNSQLIALVILLIAVSVFVWIGAFSGDDNSKNNNEVLNSTTTMQNGSQTATTEPTSTPDNTTAPVETLKPEPLKAHNVTNGAFASYDNEYFSWSPDKTGNYATDPDDKQNKVWIRDDLAESIKVDGVNVIPSVTKVDDSGDINKNIILYDTLESEHEAYLTFSIIYLGDEGPLNDILSILERNQVKATFFLGRSFLEDEGAKDMVLAIYNAGHAIGLRAVDEEYAEMSAVELADEIVGAEAAYRKIVGEDERMTLFRTSKYSERSLKVVASLGYTVVLNNFTTEGGYDGDWTETTLVDRLYERGLYDGSVPELRPKDVPDIIADALSAHLASAKESGATFKLFE